MLERHAKNPIRAQRRGQRLFSASNGRSQARLRVPRRAANLQFRWAGAISNEEWAIYRSAIRAMRETGVDFLLGGGFALATFTGRWRDTKDIDFYIRPQHRGVALRALRRAGFADYYDRRPYDRNWICRSVRSDVIVDIIWAMANQRAKVDALWFERAASVTVRGEKLKVVPREELLWCKLYILQRDHCDWTDLFNLIHASGKLLDWAHLIDRLEEDTPLLKALLMVYGWLCPKEVLELPHSLWRCLALPLPDPAPADTGRNHIRLLDTRAWCASLQPKGQKLEV